MRETIGCAGAPFSPLQPSITTPPKFGQGPFSATLRPSLYAVQRSDYPSRLSLDCLTTQPNADGLDGVRVVSEGHAPIFVDLLPFRMGQLVVPCRVSFRPGDRDVSSLGLYDDEGILWAWGSVCSSSLGTQRPVQLDFPSHQISVRPLPKRKRTSGGALHG